MANTNVLIVEHNPLIAKDIAVRLEAAGYSVCASAACEMQAVEKAEKMSPDIVLIGAESNGSVRGDQVIEKMQNRFNIPIVCLIRELTDDLIEQLADAEEVECVFHSCETNQLRLGIEKSLRRHRKLQQRRAKEAELESKLERMDERLRFMKVVFDSISNGVIASDTEGRYFMFNPTAKSLNGNALPDVAFAERSASYGLYHPDNETLFAEDELPLVRALRGEATDDIEICVRNQRNPEGTFILASGRPLYDKDGELKGGVVVTHDITKLKKVEDELRETIRELENQTKILETIVNTSADGIMAIDVNGNNLLYNARTDEVVGGNEPTIADMDQWSDLYQVYHLDSDTLYAVEDLPMVRALRGESTDHALMRVRGKDKTFVLDVNGRPLFSEQGEFIGGVTVFHDITRLRATEERLEATIRELRQQTRLMQIAFDSISDGVVVIDSDARILLTNPSLQRMSGVPVEDAPPENWQEKYGLFYLDEQTPVPTHENLLVRALAGEETREMEFFLQNEEKPGKTYLRAKAYPLRETDGGEVTGAIAVMRDITADRMAMVKMREMMRRHQRQAQLMDTVFNSLGEGIIVTDETGKFIFFNPSAEEIVGIGATQTTPDQWSDVYGIFHPDMVTPYASDELPLVHAMRGKSADNVDLFLRNSARPQGVHISVTGRPLLEENGMLRGGVCVFRDVTKLKTVENRLEKTVDELRSQTRLLNTVFDSISDGVIVVNADGDYTLLNRKAREMVESGIEGTTLNQAPERFGLYLPDGETHFPTSELPLTRSLKGEKLTDVEMLVRNRLLPKGVHVSVSSSPLLNESGSIEGGVAVARDITRIKQTEQRLKDSISQLEHQSQLMQSIFDNISDGVVASDETGQFTIFNPSAERIVGQGASDADPDEWSEHYGLFFPDKVTMFPPEELPLAKAIMGEETDGVEIFVRHAGLPDGLYISVSGRPIRGSQGELKGGVAVFRDVSDKIVAEAALTQAFSQGRIEIVDTILHNIGNSINSVVTGIGTLNGLLRDNRLIRRFNALADAIRAHQDDWADYIKNDPQGQKALPFVLALAEDFTRQNDELMHTVRRVNERATHIVDIVRTQKSFSNASAVRKDVNLRTILNDGAKLLQESMDKRGIQLDIDCGKAPREIRIQESQFHQMVVNLIKNAIEAIDELTASDGLKRPPRIKVKAYVEDNYLCLDVTDNGIGIEQAKHKTIFAAGYTTKQAGSGLGLHSTANFVVGSGGKIFPISDGIGHGTTMRIMLRLDSITP